MTAGTHAARGGAWKKTALAIGAGLVLLALAGALLWSMLGTKGKAAPKPPKIALLTPDTPPPPPPPPKFEKKPDPPKEQKEMKVDQPVQQKVEQAPSPELKMDGPAGDGPSAFAAGNITSEDLSKIGNGKGGPGGPGEAGGLFNPFDSYSNQLKGELKRYLGKQAALKRRQYEVGIKVWVGADGKLQRFELMGSAGDDDVDAALRAAITALPAFSLPPPSRMPQPIKLRVSTRI
ncbi:energy transducer TonB family protein [Massilia putida]|uniref:energy transducer TonB family protein n=1 Tax=Massilia putida TaxID=1141883 RepID=UPI0009530D22|nr:energy transducer TonB [Massilia putida]